ncbi:tRNA (adenosine(37)-N6)-threonylcarbamoyltransferase complex ATPase subunit type 1 TsaE [Actinoalloteichus spitiensis]|uniref:tRNA (adenosine(37)-N6)-threonylcarbamoyltransferase complex ATPase subunit type 1 TsaE n=1 Tax=Actinoalloteichus spitiensis TaxID=252394 RepID=UPI0003619EEA|nr:tRNA (adenosine(37)-N6)-threonylcarbamoyltransferase complex ATPase subunit type 1 TsaE [Actinoalloteichus spitiensis]
MSDTTGTRTDRWSVDLPTPEDTERLGCRVGAVALAGDLILLDGPLGAGKTVFVRGVAAALGVTGRVTSPTFVIARVHRPTPEGRGVQLVHVDAYRLGGLAELEDLDLVSDLSDSLVVVEWGAGTAERLAEEHLLVRLRRRDDDVRQATLVPHGESWEHRLAGVVAPPAGDDQRV